MKKIMLLMSLCSFLASPVFAEEDYESSAEDSAPVEQELAAPDSGATNPNWYQNQNNSGSEVIDSGDVSSDDDSELIDDSSED